ncbi:MAG: phenylalanine--tRNA ligase subunit alpha, partial [Methanomicrobia archaeon]|nr:phenylalanine--tRNA ligase subunit alpha [Methanomicrobia archaeon]
MLSLHEKKVLIALRENKEDSVENTAERAGLDEVAVMRAALWLSSKNLIKIEEKTEKIVKITDEGRKLSKKLPEREILRKIGKGIFLDQMHLENGIALGWLKKRGWARIKRIENRNFLEVTEEGKNFLNKKTKDEKILEKLQKDKMSLHEIPKDVLNILKSRKAIEIKEKIRRNIILTDLGIQEIKKGIVLKGEISQLTPEIIIKQSWRNAEFKKFNIKTDVKDIHPGKKHFVNQALEYVRSIWIEMGFKEMKGPIVDTQFWVFDALFQPQDHPARDMQDTFFLKYPEEGNLPEKELVERVK